MRPFEPFFRHPHLLTIAGNFWRRAIDESRFPTRTVHYATEPGTTIVVEENAPLEPSRGDVFLLHGLEGSSRSGYMVSMAQALLEAGYTAHRVNMRGCGGSEGLTDTLYHSGLTIDARRLLETFARQNRGPRFLCGFSLGGNVALKLAGETGEEMRQLVSGVAAVSTPIDLAACVRRLGHGGNWIYQRRFVASLKARYRRRHASFPDRFPIEGLEQTRTVFEFDDRFTSKAFGFGDAHNYYATQSAVRYLNGIAVPVLLLQAEDDPLIPFDIYRHRAVGENRWIRLQATRHGGHLGYIARRRPRFWLDGEILRWIRLVTEQLAGVDRHSIEEQ